MKFDYIYNYDEEEIKNIIKTALDEGYSILYTEWLDNWERNEGCPSISYKLDYDDIFDVDSDRVKLPESNKYGCIEWNIVNATEYISLFHTENDDEYMSAEARMFLKNKIGLEH